MNVDISLLVLGILDLVFGIGGLCGKTKIPVKYSGKSWSQAYGRDMAIGEIILGVLWIAATLIVGFVKVSSTVRMVILIGSLIPGLVYAFVASHKYKKMLNDDIP